MTTTTEQWVPHIELQRATVAFDDFCREVHDYFDEMRRVCEPCDQTPDAQQLAALLLDRVNQFVGPGQEEEGEQAVRLLVAAIARPVERWSE